MTSLINVISATLTIFWLVAPQSSLVVDFGSRRRVIAKSTIANGGLERHSFVRAIDDRCEIPSFNDRCEFRASVTRLTVGDLVVESTSIVDDRRLVTLARQRPALGKQRQWLTIDCAIDNNVESIKKMKSRVATGLTSPDASSVVNETDGAWPGWADSLQSLKSYDIDIMIMECNRFRDFAMTHRLRSEGQSIDTNTSIIHPKFSTKDQRRTRSKRSFLIYPGTNWCGRGNVAQYAAHFGDKSTEDKCCKQHDQCPYSIGGFTSRYNVFNYRLHTLSHCDCDQFFKDCLRDANSSTASMIGKVYFNVVNTQCFDLKLEKICSRRSWFGVCKREQTQWVARLKTLGSF